MIELTKSEAEALAELLETTLYDTIREDEGIDSLDWLMDVMTAYKKLKKGRRTGMKYSKDYFTGMEHLANAILCELERIAGYYEEMSRTYKGEEYYSNLEEGIGKAMDVVEKILYMQLAKGEE